MQELMVSVMDAKRAIHVRTHDGLADVVGAALAADPETIDELKIAMGRFVDAPVVEWFSAHAEEGVATTSGTEGHVVVDLAAKLIADSSGRPPMPRVGYVVPCDLHAMLDLQLPYRIPDDWQWCEDWDLWPELAQRRRHQRASSPALDTRAVLYGKVADYIVRQWCALAGEMENPVVEIQDSWLLTPRDDLLGQTPRQVLLTKREFIEKDIRDQTELWKKLGRCPPGLPSCSAAYRHAGYGKHETLLYHELVEYLLLACAERLKDVEYVEYVECVDVDDTIRHLEQSRQEWLHQVQGEMGGQSMAAVIARERARLPLVSSGGHACADDGCPVCRMMATMESRLPSVTQFENLLLEERFATSSDATREEWEQSRSLYEEFSDETRTPWDDSPPLATNASASKQPDREKPDRVWSTCFTDMALVDDMPPPEAFAVLLFGVASCVGELMRDLKQRDDSSCCSAIDNRFRELQDAIKEGQLSANSLAVSQFVEDLHRASRRHHELAVKCSDLETKLDILVSCFAQLLQELQNTRT